jgi:hypothetical protein
MISARVFLGACPPARAAGARWLELLGCCLWLSACGTSELPTSLDAGGRYGSRPTAARDAGADPDALPHAGAAPRDASDATRDAGAVPIPKDASQPVVDAGTSCDGGCAAALACPTTCGEHAACAPTQGNATCICDRGYEWRYGKCQDIDECAIHSGGCAQGCQNLEGSMICTCGLGLAVATDGRSCEAAWSQTLRVDANATGGDVFDLAIAGNDHGDVLVAWIEGPAVNDGAVRVRMFKPETGWSPIFSAGTSAVGPSVAIDRQGSAVVLWTELRSGIWQLLSSRCHIDSGFGPTVPVATDGTTSTSNPRVVIASGGDALATWLQPRNDGHTLRQSRWPSAAAGWTTDSALDDASGHAVTAHTLVGNANGQAVVAWSDSYVTPTTSATSRGWTTSFDPTLGWSAVLPIETSDPNQDVYGASAALNDSGQAFIGFHTLDRTANTQYVSSTAVRARLEAPVAIATPAGSGPVPEVAIDRQGRGLCSSVQPYDSQWRAGARAYSPGVGWSEPMLFDATAQDQPNQPRFAMNASGMAIAYWNQAKALADGQHGTAFSRYAPGTGWSLPSVIADTAAPSALKIVIDGQGHAMVAFLTPRGAVHDVSVQRLE